jgi:DNA-directed RNA polymerase subunit K/omega
LNHSVHVVPNGTKFDWTCSCGKRAAQLAATRNAAEQDALRHTPPQNQVTRHYH